MDLNEMLVFTRVVQAGSFTAAARGLEMPKSSVSRKVSDLEDRLDVRLLNRTTRKLGLTDAGRIYYECSARIVAETEEADHAVTSLQEVPQGRLRVTAPLTVVLSARWSRLPAALPGGAAGACLPPTGASISSRRASTSASGPARSTIPR